MELMQRDKAKSESLGVQLRRDNDKNLRRRRGIFGLLLTASASMSVVALYQLGILKRLPDPPLPAFDSNKVTSSAKAYSLLNTPDAVLAMGSYAATMALVAMGSPNRARERPLIPIALAAKLGFDALLGIQFALSEWWKTRTLCSWCLVATGAAIVAVPLAIPEARKALHHL
jgi:hypothetical protein